MTIIIILLGGLLVLMLLGAFLEGLGNLIGVATFSGLSIFSKIRDARRRRKSAKAARAAGMRQIRVSCPCSETFQVNVSKPGVMVFTCPKCGRKLRVDTTKDDHFAGAGKM